jgi:dipeptidyl aminopeptidase/acylaminoacyl peptidase
VPIHHEHDVVVPHTHAPRLHDALTKSGDVNKLITVKGGGHGMFAQADYINGFEEIWKFLKDNKITQ